MAEDSRNNERLNDRSIRAREHRGLSNGRIERQIRPPGVARRQHTTVVLLPSNSNPQPPGIANNRGGLGHQNQQLIGYRHSNERQDRRSSETDQNSRLLAAQELVRLDNPRPDILRKKNEYITVPSCSSETEDGRRKSEEGSKKRTSHHPPNFDRPKLHLSEKTNLNYQNRLGRIRPLVRNRADNDVRGRRRARSSDRGAPASLRILQSGAISSQPGPRLPLGPSQKMESGVGVAESGPVSTSEGNSITCKSCGKCRCGACRTRKTLPTGMVEGWVDGASCMCCVRGCLYHFGDAGREDGDEPPPVSDSDLCSCESPGCCPRWSCLICALIFLPCIWCYLPLKCCGALCQAGYSRLRSGGCRCPHSPDNIYQLDSVYDFSANNNHPVIEKANSYNSGSSREKSAGKRCIDTGGVK